MKSLTDEISAVWFPYHDHHHVAAAAAADNELIVVIIVVIGSQDRYQFTQPDQ